MAIFPSYTVQPVGDKVHIELTLGTWTAKSEISAQDGWSLIEEHGRFLKDLYHAVNGLAPEQAGQNLLHEMFCPQPTVPGS